MISFYFILYGNFLIFFIVLRTQYICHARVSLHGGDNTDDPCGLDDKDTQKGYERLGGEPYR